MDNKENINDQVATVIDIDEKPKKNHLLLKILLIVLFLVIASSLGLVLLANNTSTLQEHFDDIEAYKAQIVNKDEDRNVNLANNIIDSITYDELITGIRDAHKCLKEYDYSKIMFKDVPETLRTLKDKGYLLALASSSAMDYLIKNLNSCGINDMLVIPGRVFVSK